MDSLSKWSTHSSIIDPSIVLRGHSTGATLHRDNSLLREWHDPLLALDWLSESWEELGLDASLAWTGYLSYDLARLFERVPNAAQEVIGAPLFMFGCKSRFEAGPAGPPAVNVPPRSAPSSLPRREYLGAVERALEYISAGDVFQVNLAQMFKVPVDQPSRSIHERLERLTPGRYAAYLGFGELDVVSNSPELFLRVTPDPRSGLRRVITRPIKGTRPRLPGMDIELRDSVKDQAELNMIVDLERNDLGRVCEIGSVRVTEPRRIEAHPTVYHGVAAVEGHLRADVSFVDLLRATFPGGSVTGAPKIRAMEIIDELEPCRRGPYCGAIGYLCSDGQMEFSVAIRTMVIRNGIAHVSVGGGIVADSNPADEYEETLVKARAMFAALGVVL